MTRLEIAFDQLTFARRYTLERLDGLDERDWFRMPSEGVSHIAWQVGHLAMANYRTVLERVRGYRDEDEQLISQAFLTLFGKGSTPTPDATLYPPVAEIQAVFDRVHAWGLRELDELREADLDLPPHTPHRLYNTRWHSLLWCCQHEMLHAGQIGLLRRLFGHAPRW